MANFLPTHELLVGSDVTAIALASLPELDNYFYLHRRRDRFVDVSYPIFSFQHTVFEAFPVMEQLAVDNLANGE